MPVFGEDLATEVGRRYGAPVQMMQLNHGIFDEASISVIASDTVHEISRLAGLGLDMRRFRPNVVVRLLRSLPFQEDEWLGGVLSFGDGHEGHLAPWRADAVEGEEGAEGNVARDVAARGGEPETRARRVADVQHHRDRSGLRSRDRRQVRRA